MAAAGDVDSRRGLRMTLGKWWRMMAPFLAFMAGGGQRQWTMVLMGVGGGIDLFHLFFTLLLLPYNPGHRTADVAEWLDQRLK
jgi:hypothetical protein